MLIILASAAINLTLGNNGIFTRAKIAKEEWQNAQNYEEEQIAKVTNNIDEAISSNRENGTSSTLLWEGTANTKDTKYSFKDGVGDIEDYDFILIEYTQLTNMRHSITINTSNITKEAICDIALWGYSTRYTSIHFTDKGFMIDEWNADNNFYNYPRNIYGLKY